MRIPNHMGVIPDGNRRWARQAGLEKQEGYNYGLGPGLELLKLARQAGIREITYYGFTTDNCRRPSEQVQAFSRACVQAVERIAEQPVSLLVAGDSRSACFSVPSVTHPPAKAFFLHFGGPNSPQRVLGKKTLLISAFLLSDNNISC